MANLPSNTAQLESLLALAEELPEYVDTSEMVKVRRASGSATVPQTNRSSVSVTLNCGFKPDVVLVKVGTYTSGSGSSAINYDCNLAYVFSEKTTTSSYYLTNCSWASDTLLVSTWATVSNTGFTVTFTTYDTSWNSAAPSGQVFDWVAIKYTA